MIARILIIEDNQANLELMSYLLRAFGYEPLTASDGESGVAAAISERPDLIICDIQLPKLSGFDVARKIRSHHELSHVPLVAVTAFAMVGDRDRVLECGFSGYIAKPIEPESFVGQVERFLESGRGEKLAPPHQGDSANPIVSFPAGRRRLLIVDDNYANLELTCSIFEPMGYAVTTASDMIKALELARLDPPDLIMSDVQMAKGSGYEFVKAVRADPKLAKLPFILITSTSCDEKSRLKGLALGASKYLFRPIEPIVLLNEVEDCLSQVSQ